MLEMIEKIIVVPSGTPEILGWMFVILAFKILFEKICDMTVKEFITKIFKYIKKELEPYKFNSNFSNRTKKYGLFFMSAIFASLSLLISLQFSAFLLMFIEYFQNLSFIKISMASLVILVYVIVLRVLSVESMNLFLDGKRTN